MVVYNVKVLHVGNLVAVAETSIVQCLENALHAILAKVAETALFDHCSRGTRIKLLAGFQSRCRPRIERSGESNEAARNLAQRDVLFADLVGFDPALDVAGVQSMLVAPWASETTD